MKTNLLYLFAAVALVSAGCDKNKPETKPVPAPTKYAITVTPGEGGEAEARINGAKVTEAAEGAVVTLTATPDADYKLAQWGGEVEIASALSGTTFIMPAADVEITARFVPGTSVLINGVWWAPVNINTPGTFVAEPEDTGMYYQWNRLPGWYDNDGVLTSTTGSTVWMKTNDGGEAWDTENDPSPEGWRVPTYEEIRKLCNASKVKWQWSDSPAGYTFTDKAGGESVFFPAAGYIDGPLATMFDVGVRGFFWSSTRDLTTASGKGNSYDLGFYSGGFYAGNAQSRSNGFTVRPVAK